MIDKPSRRGLVKAMLGAAGLARFTAAGMASPPAWSPIPTRPLGRTGWKATILGFGGARISQLSESEAVKVVAAALAEGVNYFDSASTYGDHTSERHLGKALAGRDRESFFLATKTLNRSRAGAKREIAESLRSLRTHVDLLQIHAVNDDTDLDAVMARGGSLEVALAAQSAGHARFVGITGHRCPEVISRSLELYPFDTVLIPLGAADRQIASFESGTVPVAREHGVGIVGMKVLAAGSAVARAPVAELLRFTLSLPIAAAIVGLKSVEEVREAAAAARSFVALSAERMDEIATRVAPLGTPDTLWWKRV